MKSMLCNMLGHRRSRRDARRIDKRWISYCCRCGRHMVRQGPKRWIVTEFENGREGLELADRS